MISFSDYSFSIVPIDDETLRTQDLKLSSVNGSNTVEYIADDAKISVLPQTNKLVIKRNQITLLDEDTQEKIIIPEAEIYSINDFEYLNYDTHIPILVTVDEIDINGSSTGVSHGVVFSILNHNETESLPTCFRINKINWEVAPEESQNLKIGIYYGNYEYVLDEIDVVCDINGNLDKTLISKPLVSDRQYILSIYNYNTEEQKEFTIYAPIKPICGENPIHNKIEWEGRKMNIEINGIRDISRGNLQNALWGFPLDFQTHAINLRSSIMTSDTDKFNFQGVIDENHRGLPALVSYKNRIYSLPNNQERDNIYSADVLIPSTINHIRFIGLNFKLDNITNGEIYKLFSYIDSNNNQEYIGIKKENNQLKFHINNTDININILENYWYSLLLFFANIDNSYFIAAKIPDYNTPINQGALKGGYLEAIPNNESSEIKYSVNRNNFSLNIDYSAYSVSGLKIYLIVNIYQYNTSTNIAYQEIIELDPTLSSKTVTIENIYGYAIAFGFKVIIENDLITGNFQITNIKIDNNSIVLPNNSYYTINKINDYNSLTFNWNDGLQISAINIVTPLSDSELSYTSNVNNSCIALSDSPCNFCIIDNLINDNSKLSISHIICDEATVDSTYDVLNLDNDIFVLFNESVIKTLLLGYRLTPILVGLNNNSNSHVEFFADCYEELKENSIMFFLKDLNEVLKNDRDTYDYFGNIEFSLVYRTINDNSTIILTRFERIVKNIEVIAKTTRLIQYDLDFENNFDSAVNEFKSRYYAKQKRWGGDMGGGVNGELVYFDRSRKCLILEQHGDLYKGKVPAIAPAGNEWYGLPCSLKHNPVSWEDDKRFIQRNIRVAGLIQSIDYHGYGMFDCWFKVPKGMTGLAICLWYFHYQEIYDFDRAWKTWIEDGVQHADGNLYKYDQSIETGSGSTWIVINNEIDMELGSENTPYRSSQNPNNNTSLKWYAPGLSMRQAVGCTTSGDDYGTWMIDWEQSKSIIEETINTYGKDPTNSNTWIASNKLVWVKIKDTFDEPNNGASVRSCRFNNWLNERWNDGCGATNLENSGIYNRSEMDVNNRTPLGTIVKDGSGNLLELIEHYYDDGEYHKWSIDWKPTRTRLLIDDEEVAICDAFVPFNPMTMLVGCWFPSGNIYDAGPLEGNYGTWAGVHANFDVANMEVKRIKFTPYNEEEAPTTHMKYDCETYAEDGLRELIY